MEARAAASKRLESLLHPEKLPGSKSENYRYTSIKGIDFGRDPQELDQVSNLSENLLSDEEQLALAICRAATSQVTTQGKTNSGVIVESLSVALEKHSEIFSKFSKELNNSKFETNIFAQLVEAKWQSGIFIYVPKNVKVEKVIRGLNYFDSENSTFFHRTVLLVDQGAEVHYVDELAGDGRLNGSAPLASGLVQVVAMDNSRVHYSQVQNWGRNVESFIRQSLVTGRDARIEVTSFATGGARFQLRSDSDCRGSGSEVIFRGAARGDGNQHFDFWLNARHETSNTSSQMDFWTVMADSSRSVFNGTIDISKDGIHTAASQNNKNMLLSKKAVIDTFPKLLIATDDVKCAHGATVSPINREQLFYLESRGIHQDDAEFMIINGFTEPVVKALPTEVLRERVHQVLAEKHTMDHEMRAEVNLG